MFKNVFLLIFLIFNFFSFIFICLQGLFPMLRSFNSTTMFITHAGMWDKIFPIKLHTLIIFLKFVFQQNQNNSHSLQAYFTLPYEISSLYAFIFLRFFFLHFPITASNFKFANPSRSTSWRYQKILSNSHRQT